jgi:putative ABC transport system permease protein
MNVSVSKNSRTTLISKLNREWESLFPRQPLEATWYDEELYETHLHREDLQFVTLLTSMAIVLASLGLIGIVVLTITNRSKELSIRKITGASVSQLFAIAGKDFLILLVIAIVVGIPAGYFVADSLLQQYAYRVAVTPWLLLNCSAGVIALGLLIVFASTYSTVTENPTKNLRME